MSSTARTVALSLALLVVFLTAVLASQYWLRNQATRLRLQSIDEQRARLERAVALSRRPPQTWDAAFAADIGALVGARVLLEPLKLGATNHIIEEGTAIYVHRFVAAPGWQAQVTTDLPVEAKLVTLQQRTLVAMGVLALLLAVIPVLVALWARRNPGAGETESATPWAATRQEAAGLEHFARISHERGSALEREHDVRRRVEEDLSINRSLLDRSLSERARLGRELHDNLCQTLYAVCLTLESVQKRIEPGSESSQRLQHCLVELRRANQQARAYLDQLEPGAVWLQSFEAAVDDMVKALPAEEAARIERNFDPEALALIPAEQVGEVIGIFREAVSNSLRHGQANRIFLRAGRADGVIALAVQDDGRGFAASGANGHGLGNMRARAMAVGGALRIESSPGAGTCISLDLPLNATVST